MRARSSWDARRDVAQSPPAARRSYAGHQVIGPFKRFTAVIGPNGAYARPAPRAFPPRPPHPRRPVAGSGKSNLMDAVAFVLGEKTKALRGTTLRELVHAGPGASGAAAPGAGAPPAPKPKKCSVTLVFALAEGGEVHFSRGVTPSGGNEYRLDGSPVSFDAYDAKLQSVGILLEARNFLVFQGDVESVAAKTPAQLTALFELVSGSGELADAFAAAEAAKGEAEAGVAAAFRKRKQAAAEKKTKKDQAAEAAKHAAAASELRSLKQRRLLFALAGVAGERGAAEAAAAAAKQAAAAASAKQATADKELGVATKEAAVAAKAALQAERVAAKAGAAADALLPAAAKAAEEATRIARRVRDAEAAAAKAEAEAAADEAQVVKLRTKLDDITAAAEEEAAQAARERELAGAAPALTAALTAEYNAANAAAAAKTTSLRADAERARTLLKQEQDVEKAAAATVAEIDARLATLAATIEEAGARAEALSASRRDTAAAAASAAKASRDATDEMRRCAAKSERLEVSLREAEERLASYKADKSDTEREKRLSDAIAALVAAFPGGCVKGRLSDLVKPSGRKYNLAITVALGRWADAVVTDTDVTAQAAIAFLRSNRLERLSFIPVATIRCAALDERLRSLGGTSRLAVDCVEAGSPEVGRALLHALGSTLVCDTHGEAKRLAFDGPERRKVVSLDGTLCAKWGGITGGASGSHTEGGTRFDRAAYDAAKKEVDKLRAERAAAPSQRDLSAREQEAAGAAATAARTAAAVEGDAKATAERRAAAVADRDALLGARNKAEPQRAAAAARAGEHAAALAAIEARIDAVSDRECAAFCAKVGAANMREFEKRLRCAAGVEGAQDRARLAKQRATLAAQIEFVTAKRAAEHAIAARKAAAAAVAEQAKRQAGAGERDAAARAAAAVTAAARGDAAAAKARAAAAEERVASLRAASSEAAKSGGAAAREVGAFAAALAAANDKEALLVREAAMEGVTLPRLRSAGDGDDDGDGEGGNSDEEMPDAGDDGAPPPPKPARPRRFDFSSLPKAMRAAAVAPGREGEKERQRVDDELGAAAQSCASLLEKLAPNAKAAGQYAAVKAAEEAAAGELGSAREGAKAAADAFGALRKRRASAFMAAFNHVAHCVDPIYKALTRSAAHPTGGSAELMLENAADPFAEGVRFTAMPPAKRFRDMDQLSGGEKTVAALALLFAVHSFRPSPFFFLDEIDAALDKVNVERVARFVAEAARASASGGQGPAGGAQRPFQSIVISLKDAFYDKADALVGVYRDASSGGSKTLTLDLGGYGSAAPPAGGDADHAG